MGEQNAGGKTSLRHPNGTSLPEARTCVGFVWLNCSLRKTRLRRDLTTLAFHFIHCFVQSEEATTCLRTTTAATATGARAVAKWSASATCAPAAAATTTTTLAPCAAKTAAASLQTNLDICRQNTFYFI
jgi:hypothetical protein